MPSNKTLLALGLIAGSVLLLYSFQNAQSTIREFRGIIEVCANGLTYVPSDVTYVKCNGVIKKVVAISDAVVLGEDECECPNCCDGFCFIIIYTDPGPANETGICVVDGSMQIKFLWMPC